MSETQAPDATKKPETPIRRCMADMRLTLGKLEQLQIPAVERLTSELRWQMVDLVMRLNELDGIQAARRMVGDEEQLVPQEPIDTAPLFARPITHSPPSAEHLERMKRTLHRANDHTLDSEGDAAA